MITDELAIEEVSAHRCKACGALFPDSPSAYEHLTKLSGKTLPFGYQEGSSLWFDTSKTKLAQSPDHQVRVLRVELVRNYRDPDTHENMCVVKLLEPYNGLEAGHVIEDYSEVALSHREPKPLPTAG